MSVRLQHMEKSKKGGKTPLGEKITQAIKSLSFETPADFAEENGISVSTLNDLLYGKTKIFPESLLRVASAIGTEPWQLLIPEGTPYPPPAPQPPTAAALAQAVAEQQREIEALKAELERLKSTHPVPPDVAEALAHASPDMMLVVRMALGLSEQSVSYRKDKAE